MLDECGGLGVGRNVMDTIEFRLNGKTVRVEGIEPHTTLLSWLRGRGLTGSKEGCAEGECGACAVLLLRPDGQGSRLEAVNGCLLLLPSLAGQEVWTVEGLAQGDRLHPVQEAMLQGGSQCGYCTPGFVVSMAAEYYRKGRQGFDLEALSGNLCRCTGYRPIRDAAPFPGELPPDDPWPGGWSNLRARARPGALHRRAHLFAPHLLSRAFPDAKPSTPRPGCWPGAPT